MKASKYWLGEHRRSPRLTQVGYLHDKSRALLLKRAVNTKLSSSNNLEILDVGCGEKPYYPFFKGKVDEYIGIDINRWSNVDIICSGEALAFKDKMFDVILCVQTLEHLTEPKKALRECQRVLKSDGLLLLFVPSFWPLHHAPHDYYRWTRYGIEIELRCVGFNYIEIFNCGGSVSGILQMIMFAIDGFFSSNKLIKKFLSFCVYPILNIIGFTPDKKISNWAFTANLFVVAK